jgi:putative membrane protein
MKTLPIIGAALLMASCSGSETADPAEATSDTQMTGNVPADSTAATSTASTAQGQPTDAAGYVAMAGAGDLWEIESSKALLAKSANADLKKFAQMMIDNHTQSTQKIKTAAQSAQITPAAPKLDADQQRMLDEIKAANASGIDEVYIRHQRTAHDKALALHQNYATNGDDQALKKVAGEVVPVIQKHITELGNMSTTTG